MVTLGRTYGDKTPTHSAAERFFGFGTTICFLLAIQTESGNENTTPVSNTVGFDLKFGNLISQNLGGLSS